MVFEAEVKRDAIESPMTAAEHDGPPIVDDDAWSGTEAKDKDADADANSIGCTRESGVEEHLGEE